MEKDRTMGINTAVPHSARIWNYWQGGKDNYPIDREVGDRFRNVYPGIVENALAYREFLARAVLYLAAEEGIRQFLDIGTGLPTADNTHKIAQHIAPRSRTVFVDNDPLVLAYARALLTSMPEGITDYLDVDVREPDKILRMASSTLDFTQPIALILSGIMGHIADDEEPHTIVNRLVSGLPAGSYLMLQDGTTVSEAGIVAVNEYNKSGAVPYHLRDPDQITRFFDGLELLEPGVVPIKLWRSADPEGNAEEVGGPNAYGGVGRKP